MPAAIPLVHEVGPYYASSSCSALLCSALLCSALLCCVVLLSLYLSA